MNQFVMGGFLLAALGPTGVIICCIVLLAALALLILSSLAMVPTGHTGVLTTFGKVENRTLDSGIHWKKPWQKLINMDNRVQKARLRLNCYSADIQEVSVIYTVNYQIRKDNAMTIYSTIGKSYYETVFTPNVSEAVEVMTARYTAENLISSRDELAELIESLLKEKLAQYHILVVGTSIEGMEFTEAFTNAVESKQVAAQNKLQAEIEQSRKTMEQEAQAQRNVIDANAASEVARIQAEADLRVTKIQADAAEYAGQKEAAKNKAISEFLTKDLLDYYYIQQWNGKLPSNYVSSDKVNTLLTLEKERSLQNQEKAKESV